MLTFVYFLLYLLSAGRLVIRGPLGVLSLDGDLGVTRNQARYSFLFSGSEECDDNLRICENVSFSRVQ